MHHDPDGDTPASAPAERGILARMTGDGPDTADSTGSLESGGAGARDPGLPRRIGHYTVKRLIGTGGMGAVYEAVQEQPRRVVALKVLRAGIAGKSALRRFEYESQLLARLRHPGIAQVYEAGTHESEHGAVPFFAMEYIPGARTITDFAAAKKLGTRERMELLARVCDAVHHGHQKGIIHRDLKPGNILVDSAGDPKIIDFGVARATDSDMAVTTLQTDIGQLIGTLQYMSPEQCAADPHDIDTRSDVYALGVVLYELLCGKMPYDVSRSAIAEATRKIREEEPAKLSTLDRTLRGDPETIALKALEKERERRYRSAADLADDIRRCLKGEPISARPPSVAYQVRVFAKRHRVLVVAVIVVVAVMTAAAAVSGRYWYDAARARDAAIAALKAADEARSAEVEAKSREREARRAAEVEAANARFREAAARARAIDAHLALQSLVPAMRAGEDAVALIGSDGGEEFARGIILDTEEWLEERFPELFGTAASGGGRSMLRVYIDEYDRDRTDDTTRAEIDTWVRGARTRLEELQRAAREAVFGVRSTFDGSDRPLVSGLLTPLGQLRTVGAALVLHGAQLAREERYGEAFAALRTARRLARDVAGGGLLMAAVIEWRMRSRVYVAFRTIGVQGADRGMFPQEAVRFVATDAPICSGEIWLDVEGPAVRQLVDGMFSKADESSPARFDPARAARILAEAGEGHAVEDLVSYAGADYDATMGALERVWERNRALTNLPIEELVGVGRHEFDALVRGTPVLGLVTPDLRHTSLIRALLVMERDATIISAAVSAWRAARGEWPASIDLALDGFPAQPLRRDYFGRDFVYRVENDRPVLYSVGPDGRDDGGAREWDDQKKGSGDLVYIAPGAVP